MVSLQLLWVVLIGLIFALIIQSLAANLGVVTGIQFGGTLIETYRFFELKLIDEIRIKLMTISCNSHAGRHLAELCKSEYPKFVMICLWLLAELAVIAADIPEG
jgi:natural resistance-associated macrophage protein